MSVEPPAEDEFEHTLNVLADEPQPDFEEDLKQYLHDLQDWSAQGSIWGKVVPPAPKNYHEQEFTGKIYTAGNAWVWKLESAGGNWFSPRTYMFRWTAYLGMTRKLRELRQSSRQKEKAKTYTFSPGESR